MSQLAPLDPALAATVGGWATDEVEAWQWCSRREAPVAAEVVAAWSSAPDVEAFLLYDGTEPVGYGELWLDDEEAEVELARLIVSPDHRGRGHGRRLTTGLTREARRHHSTVALRVNPDNHGAQACYRSAGFTRVPAVTEAEWNAAQPIDYVWMTHTEQADTGR